MSPATTTDFRTLYPEVDPTKGLPLTVTERLALVVSLGVTAFGAVSGDITIAGVGLALTVLASLTQSQKTARRIRYEARQRFPGEDWAEYRSNRNLNLGLLVPLFMAVIIALCAAGFWFIPLKYATLGAAVIALVVAVLVWFMPGLNPIWSSKKQPAEEPQPQQQQQQQPYRPTSSDDTAIIPTVNNQ